MELYVQVEHVRKRVVGDAAGSSLRVHSGWVMVNIHVQPVLEAWLALTQQFPFVVTWQGKQVVDKTDACLSPNQR
jgi:hypothetical protein